MPNTDARMIPAGIPNPFLDGVMPDAWKQTQFDVESIHQDVFEKCCDAVGHLRRTGGSVGVLLFGEAGSGKTHLLSRLRSRLAGAQAYPELQDRWQIFVAIQLSTISTHLWRHIRQRFVDDLLRRMPDGLTQLEHILAKQLASRADGEGDLAYWWDYMRKERADDLDDLLYELAQETQTDDGLLTVLTHFLHGKHRRYVRSYLRGGMLTEEGSEALFGKVVRQDSEPDPELEAREMVVALCRLANSTVPVVFCFDQVEALSSADQERSPLFWFAEAASYLWHNAKVAIISCVLSEFYKTGRPRV